MGMRRILVWASLIVIALAAFLRHPHIYPWTIYTLDYFLGNPSSFRALRDRIFDEEAKSWPIPKSANIPAWEFPQIMAEDYTIEAFKIVTSEFTRPVVLRGLFANSAALKWTHTSLANHFGPNRSFVAFSHNKMGDQDPKNGESFYETVPEAVANITRGGNNYIFNAPIEVDYDLELYKELDVDRFSKSWRKPAVIQFFLGLARLGEKRLGGSALHSATAPNLNVQLSGAKKMGYDRP